MLFLVTVAAVANMAIFFSSLCFLSMLLRYCLNDFETVPVAPIITRITLILYSTCAGFLLQSPYILKSFRLLFDHISIS